MPATAGSSRWRVRRTTAADGTVVVVSLPLGTLDGATAELVGLDVLVLLVVILALVAVSQWVVASACDR